MDYGYSGKQSVTKSQNLLIYNILNFKYLWKCMTSHKENSHLKIHHARVLKTYPTNMYMSDVVLQINNRVPKLYNATPKICPFHYIVHVDSDVP